MTAQPQPPLVPGTDSPEFSETAQANGWSRRQFLTGSLVGGGGLALLGAQSAMAQGSHDASPYVLARPEAQIYTACLQCNTGCGVKAKIQDGVVVKIDGSPYSPWCLYPHLPYATSPFAVARVDGHLCPKGAAGIQTAYDPYRIRKVLKRAGKRGSMQWITIPFEQAVREIVEGGNLFAHVPGEENRTIEGLRAVRALTDDGLSKELAADIGAVSKRTMTVAEFQAKHAAHLDLLIDPEHPDLGPKNNQLVFMFGRLKAGRSDFIKRWVLDAYGTVNLHGHTTVCQGSLYFTGKAMSEQYVYDEKDAKVKWTGGDKFYWQGDVAECEFALMVGTGVWEGGYGPPLRTPRITEAIEAGRLKMAVVDPRFSKLASKAWKWLPAKAGSEGAFALAMIRWIIEQEKYNATFLANANKGAAEADGEATWTNAAWLVKCEEKDGELVPGAFLYGSDLGLPKRTMTHTKPVEKPVYDADGKPVLDAKGKPKTEKINEPVLDKEGLPVTYELDMPVVLRDGQFITFDPNDGQEIAEGDLFAERTVNVSGKDGTAHPVVVKTSLQLLKESASEHTIEEWADICGLEPGAIVDVAREFAAHGRKSVADIHRGVSQHTNGYYNVLAFFSLNLLMGNFDHKGGMIKGTTFGVDGTKTDQPFPLGKLHPGKLTTSGINSIRYNIKYEDTTLFDPDKGKANYPAKRPWWPLASDIYQEIVPSIADQYPYAARILISYMAAPTYALPAGHTNITILQDVQKLPLHIASDITIGETSMYADYIFPDLSYLERWEFQGTQMTVSHKVQPVRQPAIAPIPESVRVYGEEQPICLESMLLAFAEALELPGFGPEGFGPGVPLMHFDQFHLKGVANLAAGEKPILVDNGTQRRLGAVPDASPEEMQLFLDARKHLPRTIFDPARWEAAVGADLWPKVVYVLNRGGRLEDFDQAYEGQRVKNRYAKQANIYCEKTAKTKSAITGKAFYGIARYLPIADVSDAALQDEAAGFDLQLITYRDITQTKSRTISNYYLNALRNENSLLMNPVDARRRGLSNGARIRISSASNPEGVWDLGPTGHKPMIGRLEVTEGIRPGVVAFSLGHGHWAMGSQDFMLDGQRIRGDARRASGVHANAAMRLDPVLQNTCLLDPVGGSVSFYDTMVRVEAV